MKDEIKIRISNAAYDKLFSMLKDNCEYTHIRLRHLGKCCRGENLELVLDKLDSTTLDAKSLTTSYIEELPFLYDKELVNDIREVTIIYKNSSFLIKVEGNSESTSCGECKEGCSNCKH